MGSYSVVQCIRHLMDQPLYCCWFSCEGRQRVWWWPHPLCMTQQVHIASTAAWLSSTGISQHNLLPHIPLIHLTLVNRSPCPGIAPLSLNSGSQLLGLVWDLHPCLGYVCRGKDYLILIPFRLSQISCFTHSLKCFSSDANSCSEVGIKLLLQLPHSLRAGQVLLTLLFFPLLPSSYWVFCGSIYSFLAGQYSCPFLAGVLHALLCLKVYS